MGIKITGKFDTGGGEYPLVEDTHLEGGFRVVATIEERDNIPDLRRKSGMVVYCQEDGKFWQLQDDLISWVEVSLGGGSSSFDGWEGEVETFADLPDPADHLGEQWLVQKATGTWTLFNRKKAGLYEARKDEDGNPKWFYLGVQIHKITEVEKQNPCAVDEVRRYTPKDICDIIDKKTYWEKTESDTGIGKQLQPNNQTADDVQRIAIKRNVYGIVEINVTNENNSDNYAGAGFTASTSADPYKDQVFLTMYPTSFYQAYLAGKGGNLSDKQLVVGAYGDQAQYDIALGNDFASIKPYFSVTKDAFDFKMKNPIFYSYAKTPKPKPENAYVIGIDINTGELFSFNDSSDTTNRVFIYRKGKDISGKNLLFLKRYVFKNKNLFKVWVNGVEYEDWDFGNQVQSLNPDYTTHLKFNTTLNSDDEIKIEYLEPINLGDYKLVLYRKEGSLQITSRPKMITKFITDSHGNKFYLKEVSILGEELGYKRYSCKYIRIDNPDIKIIVEKASPNFAYIAEFPKEETLPDGFWIEVWKSDSKSPNTKHIPNNMEAQGRLIPIGKFTINKISNLDKNGIYHFRLGKTDESGNVLFSRWLSSVVSVRTFPVFTIDASDSENKFVGDYKLMKII